MTQRAQLRNSAAWLVAGGGVCLGIGYSLARTFLSGTARRLRRQDVVETATTDPDWVPPNKQPPPEGNKGERCVCVCLALALLLLLSTCLSQHYTHTLRLFYRMYVPYRSITLESK